MKGVNLSYFEASIRRNSILLNYTRKIYRRLSRNMTARGSSTSSNPGGPTKARVAKPLPGQKSARQTIFKCPLNSFENYNF